MELGKSFVRRFENVSIGTTETFTEMYRPQAKEVIQVMSLSVLNTHATQTAIVKIGVLASSANGAKDKVT